MNELERYISLIIDADIRKIVISKPALKSELYKRIVIQNKGDMFQASKYTKEQVFHENITPCDLREKCMEYIENRFRQINGITDDEEHIILISKKDKCSYKVRKNSVDANGVCISKEHDRRKKYILEEGTDIEPLTDMGIFTKDKRIVSSMYDKYRQINRFIEILDDEISNIKPAKLNIIDFGCGKSYLTFVVYYYLTEIMKIDVNMIGLDLKADVIEKCNIAAKKYNYRNLKFVLGDINGFEAPFDVDMVITLHACDTATDYALYNAIKWKARMIFSVPCCQHELNRQIKPNNIRILSRYGIIKERFCALATDAIRGNLLEYCGYKTQLLEFIDFEHTPKNILIRAVLKPMTPKDVRQKALSEVFALAEEFSFEPILLRLLDII